jgi:hypothetical protein
VLEHPELVVAELKRQADEQRLLPQTTDIDSEISKLRKNLRTYEKQERKLIVLLRHSQVTQDYVLDEINSLKKDQLRDQEELKKLLETKVKLSHLADAEIKLNEFCQRVRQKLDNATIQDKRLAFNALDIRVRASTQKIEIKGIIPVELIPSVSSAEAIHHWTNIGITTCV